MKKLTREEANNISTRPAGRGSIARTYLLTMNVGDIILLETKDWKWKSRKPSTFCRRLEKETGRQWKCDTALDGSGWVIERIK
ncbi:MAG: hypothetical protein KBF73_12830 [Flavobacteriales bacterium]|nr:hypothetical protein [Flavobacteriales bacterium]